MSDLDEEFDAQEQEFVRSELSFIALTLAKKKKGRDLKKIRKLMKEKIETSV